MSNNFHEQFFVVCNIFQSHHLFKMFNCFVLAKKGKCWWPKTQCFWHQWRLQTNCTLTCPPWLNISAQNSSPELLLQSLSQLLGETSITPLHQWKSTFNVRMLKKERHKIDKFPMTIYVPWPMTSNIECHDDMMDHHWWLVSVFRFCFSCCCCFWSRAKKERGPFWKAGHRPVRFQFNAVLARYTVPVVSVAVSSTTSRCYKTFNSDVLGKTL